MNKILKVSLCSFIAFLLFFGGKLTANAATLYFNTDGGTPVAPVANTGYFPQTVFLNLHVTQKTGYTFLGWFLTPTGGTAQNTYSLPAGPGFHNVYAHWNATKYSISYELDGGSASGNPTEYTIESDPIILNDAEKDGYNFLGWTGTNVDTPTKGVEIQTGSSGNRSYTANYEAIIYNVEYALDGGTVDGENPAQYTIEDDDFTLINPTKEGYEFIGWTGSNGNTPELKVTVNTSDLENKSFKANYLKKVKLIVNYLDSSGNSVAEGTTIDYLENDLYESPGAVEVSGYVLDNSRLPKESGEFGDEDITLNYYYNGLYTVKFNTNGGSTINDLVNVVEGSKIDLASYEPTRKGYIFLGWYDEDGNLITTITVDKDREVTAKWEKVATGATFGEDSGNPNTADNVLLYVIGLLLSLVALVTTTKLRKNS